MAVDRDKPASLTVREVISIQMTFVFVIVTMVGVFMIQSKVASQSYDLEVLRREVGELNDKVEMMSLEMR